MLEFKKRILQKVSFDLGLFKRELEKAIAWLDEDDAKHLRDWCYNHFGGKYHKTIEQCYKSASTTA